MGNAVTEGNAVVVVGAITGEVVACSDGEVDDTPNVGL